MEISTGFISRSEFMKVNFEGISSTTILFTPVGARGSCRVFFIEIWS